MNYSESENIKAQKLLSKKKEGGVLHLPKTPDFPENRSISVKLRHLFYTDVKAEHAGPMPAMLVPTRNGQTRRREHSMW